MAASYQAKSAKFHSKPVGKIYEPVHAHWPYRCPDRRSFDPADSSPSELHRSDLPDCDRLDWSVWNRFAADLKRVTSGFFQAWRIQRLLDLTTVFSVLRCVGAALDLRSRVAGFLVDLEPSLTARADTGKNNTTW